MNECVHGSNRKLNLIAIKKNVIVDKNIDMKWQRSKRANKRKLKY